LDFSQGDFEELLSWLDPNDRDSAGRKYLTIHAGLTRIFVREGAARAEDFADEVIRRVIKRLPEIRIDYVGDPANYFGGVARYVVRELVRPKEIATDEIPVGSIRITNKSDEYECLKRCLRFLDAGKRDLILDYHVYQGHDKIETHRTMAEELGITEGALRGRAHRIRSDLEECVLKCVQSLRKTKPSPTT
jgi:DNA-directed RNA polymerase specialized sigma24 family protein